MEYNDNCIYYNIDIPYKEFIMNDYEYIIKNYHYKKDGEQYFINHDMFDKPEYKFSVEEKLSINKIELLIGYYNFVSDKSVSFNTLHNLVDFFNSDILNIGDISFITSGKINTQTIIKFIDNLELYYPITDNIINIGIVLKIDDEIIKIWI